MVSLKFIPIKKFLLKILLLCAALAVSGVLVELGLRAYARVKSSRPRPESIFVLDASGLVLHKPNIDRKFYIEETGEYTHFKTNAEGFVGETIAPEKPAGVTRIAVLGDSFVEGAYTDYEKNLTSRLSQILARAPGNPPRTFEVMNFGVGGRGTFEELLYFDRYVKKYAPDLTVLVLYMGNDYIDNHNYLPWRPEVVSGSLTTIHLDDTLAAGGPNTDAPPKSLKELFLRVETAKVLLQIVKNNELLFRLAHKTGIFKNPFKGETDKAPFSDLWFYANPSSKRHEEVIAFTADTVNRMEKEAASVGSKFALVIIPSHWQADPRYARWISVFDYPLDLTYLNRKLLQHLTAGMRVTDLTEKFGDAIAHEKKNLFILGRGHLTEEGLELVGRELYTTVIASLEPRR